MLVQESSYCIQTLILGARHQTFVVIRHRTVQEIDDERPFTNKILLLDLVNVIPAQRKINRPLDLSFQRREVPIDIFANLGAYLGSHTVLVPAVSLNDDSTMCTDRILPVVAE